MPLLFLIAIQLAVIWSFRYLPSQDAPAHLNNANVLRHLLRHDSPIYQQFYALNPRPNPNWLGHLILALLQFIASPVVAQKMLISGYLILLPLAARYALRAIRRESAFLAILIIPFSTSYLFQKGFYNFCYSLPLFFFVVGFWWKHRDHFTLSRAMILMLLSLLLYFSHPLTLMLAYVAIGLVTLATLAVDRYLQRPLQFKNRLVLPLLALTPTLVLVLAFVSHEGGAEAGGMSFSQRAFILLDLDVLYTFRPTERYLSAAVALIFGVILIIRIINKSRRRCWGLPDVWLVLAIVFTTIFFLTPNATAGGSWITHRLALFPYFALLLWFATATYPPMFKLWLQFAAATITICFAALHAARIAAYQPYLKDFLSVAPHLPEGSTLQPIILSETGSRPINRAGTRTQLLARHNLKPFVQLSGLVAAQRNLVDLSNYEAQLDYFPTRFRPNATSSPPDYILIWQTYGGDGTKPPLPDLANYEKIYTSPKFFAVLYRRATRATSP